MFKKHAIQMRFVKDAENDVDAPETISVDPEQIAKIATEYTVKAIGAVGVVIAANKALNTICEIAVIAAKAKFK